MLTVITNPTGIDVRIRKLQEKIYNRLSWTDYNSYGRCYRNKAGNNYIAEVYAGANEYKEVYWDDTLTAISFFGVSQTVVHKLGELADVHLVFFVNIAKLKPLLLHRADEEIRMEVMNIVGRGLFGFTYTSIETGIENVLKEYPGSVREKRLATVDMHPIHCFRLNLKLAYNNKDCF